MTGNIELSTIPLEEFTEHCREATVKEGWGAGSRQVFDTCIDQWTAQGNMAVVKTWFLAEVKL